ncbi:DUF3014 domain-containing protein [Pseudoalteromonas sp. MM17-2]|uniref:DUF3014 domain-containing protein n=1 Tax=Pseudoalteromonas sp. MM17-2 TaxID=2917753 RepID=UPI001EF44ED0|nr:DUF3014 domain-containing protein [Pseudoalteromonas sp. MM17-2]MCG7545931.1 DUF3014 domain-containing protein [Pseudoalteromonas sp. MM17-2]
MSEQPTEHESKRGPSRNNIILALVVLVVLAVVVIFVVSKQSQQPLPLEATPEPAQLPVEDKPQPVAEPEPENKPQAAPTTTDVSNPDEQQQRPQSREDEQPEPQPELPALDDSDEMVSASLQQSLAQSSANLLVNDDLIRRTVVFVNNLAEGRVATNHSPVEKLEQPFTVEEGDVLTMDPKSFERYDPYVGILTSMNTDQLVALYEQYEPLIEQAYGEVGDPNNSFEARLKQSIDLLLETPEMTTQVPLLRDSVTYKYAYSEWENLPPAQKQLLRMGPENVEKVKAVLKKLRAELD